MLSDGDHEKSFIPCHFDASFVEQTEGRGLVDAESAVFRHSCEKLVIVRPLEDGPHVRLFGVERTLLDAGSRLPNDDRRRFLRRAVAGVRGKGDQVVFAGRKVDELDVGVLKLGNLREIFAAPHGDAPGVKSGQVSAQWRPLDVGFGPSRPHFDHGDIRHGIEVDGDLLSALVDDDVLVAGVGFQQVSFSRSLVLERFRLGRFPLIRNTLVFLEIGE